MWRWKPHFRPLFNTQIASFLQLVRSPHLPRGSASSPHLWPKLSHRGWSGKCLAFWSSLWLVVKNTRSSLWYQISIIDYSIGEKCDTSHSIFICSHQRTAIASKPLTYPLTKCQIRNCRTVSTVPTSLKRSTCNVHPNGFNMHFNALLCNKHISACLRLPPCADLVFEFMLGDSSISHNDHAGPQRLWHFNSFIAGPSTIGTCTLPRFTHTFHIFPSCFCTFSFHMKLPAMDHRNPQKVNQNGQTCGDILHTCHFETAQDIHLSASAFWSSSTWAREETWWNHIENT